MPRLTKSRPALSPLSPLFPPILQGKYNPLPKWNGQTVLPCQWQEWATVPPIFTGVQGGKLVYDLDLVDEYLKLVYKQGWLDGRSFVLDKFPGVDPSKLPLDPPGEDP